MDFLKKKMKELMDDDGHDKKNDGAPPHTLISDLQF